MGEKLYLGNAWYLTSLKCDQVILLRCDSKPGACLYHIKTFSISQMMETQTIGIVKRQGRERRILFRLTFTKTLIIIQTTLFRSYL